MSSHFQLSPRAIEFEDNTTKKITVIVIFLLIAKLDCEKKETSFNEDRRNTSLTSRLALHEERLKETGVQPCIKRGQVLHINLREEEVYSCSL